MSAKVKERPIEADSWTVQYKLEMARLRELTSPFKVELPEGTSGDWAVERFEVPEEPNMYLMRAHRDGRAVPGGTYTRLKNNTEPVFMSDTPAELGDLFELLTKAEGDILITGLGIGMLPRILLSEELLGRVSARSRRLGPITSVTVVELEQDVINLVAPHLEDPRLTVVHGDAFKWKPGKDQRFDWAWHDIWPSAPGPCEVKDIMELRGHYGRYMRKSGRQLVWLEDMI
jgi:hypothetical protein